MQDYYRAMTETELAKRRNRKVVSTAGRISLEEISHALDVEPETLVTVILFGLREAELTEKQREELTLAAEEGGIDKDYLTNFVHLLVNTVTESPLSDFEFQEAENAVIPDLAQKWNKDKTIMHISTE